MGATTVAVTTESFQKEVLEADLPVVVDLWAAWCGPCQQIAPLLDELAVKYDGKVKICKVNVDEEPGIAQAFEVQSIPTMAVLYKGGMLGTVVGFGGRGHVEQVFEEVSKIPEKVASGEIKMADPSETPT